MIQSKENLLKLTEIEKKLKNYILTNFDINQEKISLKFIHTFNTRLVSDEISLSLNLCERDLYLSSIIALFHDYSRFEQFKVYGTYNDLLSVDHGNLAVKRLFDEKEIFNFVNDLTDEELEIVRLAIKNHNKLGIEEGLSERQLLFCKIIRDADKVDIFRILSNDPRVNGVKQGKLLQKDINTFLSGKLFKKTKHFDIYKSLILHLCLIYDFNFSMSYTILMRNQYLNKYLHALKDQIDFELDNRIEMCFNVAYKYIEEQSKKEDKC